MKGDTRTCHLCGELLSYRGAIRAFCINKNCKNYDKNYKPPPPMYPADEESTPLLPGLTDEASTPRRRRSFGEVLDSLNKRS